MRISIKPIQWGRALSRIMGGKFTFSNLLDQDAKRVIQHYDNLAPHYSNLYEGHSSMAFFYNIRKKRIYELLEGLSGGSILEVGCASGKLVDYLVKKDMQYCGIDISGGMIKKCKETFSYLKAAQFAVGDTRNLPFSKCLFDVVMCIGMLEYVAKEDIAIKELARVLKPGGICIISGINRWSPYNVWDRIIYRNMVRRWPAAIVHEYHSEKEYRKWLTRENLMVTDVVYFDFDLFFPPLNKHFGRLAVSISEKLEPYCRGQLKRLSKGFIMKCIKTI